MLFRSESLSHETEREEERSLSHTHTHTQSHSLNLSSTTVAASQVRDRAAILLRAFATHTEESDLKCLFDEPMPMYVTRTYLINSSFPFQSSLPHTPFSPSIHPSLPPSHTLLLPPSLTHPSPPSLSPSLPPTGLSQPLTDLSEHT